MFGFFGYRKRALAAEARVKDLEGALVVWKKEANSYRDKWLAARTPAREVYQRQSPSSVLRSQIAASSVAPAQYSNNPPAPAPSGGFDITSALIGGLVGHSLASTSSTASDSDSCSRSSFSSGGGGDFGGGGASSSWDSSSSSSSSDSSYSSSDSSSSSSSSD